MSNLQLQLRPLLAQFTNATGRGNLISANDALIKIIQSMATAIDEPCACCAPAPRVQVSEAAPRRLDQSATPKPAPRPRGRPRKIAKKA